MESLPLASRKFNRNRERLLDRYCDRRGQQINVTASVTWQTGTPGILTVQNGIDPMCVQSNSTMTGATTVFAQYVSGTTTITSNSVTVTVQ